MTTTTTETSPLPNEATNGTPPRPSSLQSSPYARVIGAVEELQWLEAVASKLDPLLAPLTQRRRLMDLLHGRWLGHAFHPLLTDLPIGFWAAVPVLDLAGNDSGATVMTAAGCAAAVAAALTGVADWTVTYGRDRRLGLVHGVINTAGLVLQLGALTARGRGAQRSARGLSLAGFGISVIAAYAGGELVFGRGLMVDHTAGMSGPSEWTAVLRATDLADGAIQAVEVEGRKVLLARVDGHISAIEETCSHAGGPLSEGMVENGVVQCPWHGSRFRLRDGAVVSAPATFPQPRLETRVVNGRIEVRGREG